MKPKILNSKGEQVVLNEREQAVSRYWENHIKNALGFEVDITTLTTIVKKVSEQKFFHVAPADYFNVRVGEGAWSEQLITYRSFDLADDFATGLLNTGANNTRLAAADSGVDSVPVKVNKWAKAVAWSLFDIQQAAKSGNWDIVSAKERARKRNWDLGIQKVAFLGIANDSNVLGLLNQSGITENTTRITQPISSMSTVDFKNFLSGLMADYRSNCARTAWPTHFVIPESDYLGLAAPTSADFPLKVTLEVLVDMFKIITGNPNFKVLPLAYADAEHNSLSKQMYALYNAEEESLRMDIPVDYTSTLASSSDNFNFSSAAYGQFTGVLAYRPKELLYFTHTL